MQVGRVPGFIKFATKSNAARIIEFVGPPVETVCTVFA